MMNSRKRASSTKRGGKAPKRGRAQAGTITRIEESNKSKEELREILKLEISSLG